MLSEFEKFKMASKMAAARIKILEVDFLYLFLGQINCSNKTVVTPQLFVLCLFLMCKSVICQNQTCVATFLNEWKG